MRKDLSRNSGLDLAKESNRPRVKGINHHSVKNLRELFLSLVGILMRTKWELEKKAIVIRSDNKQCVRTSINSSLDRVSNA